MRALFGAVVALQVAFAGPAHGQELRDQLGDRLPPIDSIVRLLRDTSWAVREAAGSYVGRYAPSDAGPMVPGLIELATRDPEPRERSYAVRQLGLLRRYGCPAVPALLKLATDQEYHIRSDAMTAFGYIGITCLAPALADSVLATLGHGVSDRDRRVRGSPLEALGRIGPAATTMLLKALHNHDELVAARAAQLLGHFEAAPRLVDALIVALDSRSFLVRLEAAHALGGYGRTIRPALDGATPTASPRVRVGLREAARYLASVSALAVAGRCFRLAVGTWAPPVHQGADTTWFLPPSYARFSIVKFDARLGDTVPEYRFEAAGGADDPTYDPGHWRPAGDSLIVYWNLGMSGIDIRLVAGIDTLTGVAVTRWDVNTAGVQSAPVRLTATSCP